MESQNNLQQMVTTLSRESELCNRLLAALNIELEALRQNSPEQLESAVKEKQECVSALEQNEKILFGLLPDNGFSHDANGFTAFLDTLQGNDPLGINMQWETLLQQINECRKLNQVNGRILNASLASTQHALNLLNGREESTPTYSPSGKSDDDKDGQHSLAIA